MADLGSFPQLLTVGSWLLLLLLWLLWLLWLVSRASGLAKPVQVGLDAGRVLAEVTCEAQ